MKPRILIIDDEKEIRELYISFLEGEDYDLFEAENGQEAFKMAAEERFDLYITDIFMPEINGVEFMKILKQIDPDAVVVIITGYDNMEYTRQALDYGAFRFLTKPVKMSEFRSIVELGLLEHKKLFQATTIEKLIRMKNKLDNNLELRDKVYEKLRQFLLEMENFGPSYIEIGGPGSQGKVWGKFRSNFNVIPSDKQYSQDEINIMALTILNNEQLNNLINNKMIQFNYSFNNDGILHRFRITIYFETNEIVVGFKTTRRTIINLEEIGFNQSLLNRLTFKGDHSGLVIFTGPSGSGKSSLIDAFINLNNTYLAGNIVIIADSIEYYHESKNSVVRHQELFRDVNTLSDALKQCHSYSPNLVVVEEITNMEIMDKIFELVDSNCLVYACLRAKSVLETLYKLLSLYPSGSLDNIRKQLSRSLECIMSLHLIPTKKKKLVMAKEILLTNEQVKHLLANGNIDEVNEMMQQGKKSGMQTIDQDLLHLIKQGIISVEAALEVTHNQKKLKDMIQFG